jgi:hypothetical protein
VAHRFILYGPVSDHFKLWDVAPCNVEDKIDLVTSLNIQQFLHPLDGTILKGTFKKWDGVWSGLIWLSIGRDGGLL